MFLPQQGRLSMKLDFHGNHQLLFSVVFFAFVFLSLIIAVGPALWVQDHNRPLPGVKPLTSLEKGGLDIYIAEGCGYCHSQQVRPIEVDRSWGRPSAPGDYALLKPLGLWRMTPEILGTQRTGPDLSNVANRQSSEIWNAIHLFNPRSVVKSSVMQAYPWLFHIKENPGPSDGVVPIPENYAPQRGKVILSSKARALLAYILSRKQVPLSKKTSEETASAAPQSPSPQKSEDSESMGIRLYNTYCAGCHQANGEGLPGTFPPLKNDPVVTDDNPERHIQIVLFGLEGQPIEGKKYTAQMPAHADTLSDEQIAAVVNHERTSWGNKAPVVTPQDVERIRKKGKPQKWPN
jgi:cytochrome c oxidase cbb3-type subunit 2